MFLNPVEMLEAKTSKPSWVNISCRSVDILLMSIHQLPPERTCEGAGVEGLGADFSKVSTPVTFSFGVSLVAGGGFCL